MNIINQFRLEFKLRVAEENRLRWVSNLHKETWSRMQTFNYYRAITDNAFIFNNEYTMESLYDVLNLASMKYENELDAFIETMDKLFYPKTFLKIITVPKVNIFKITLSAMYFRDERNDKLYLLSLKLVSGYNRLPGKCVIFELEEIDNACISSLSVNGSDYVGRFVHYGTHKLL